MGVGRLVRPTEHTETWIRQGFRGTEKGLTGG